MKVKCVANHRDAVALLKVIFPLEGSQAQSGLTPVRLTTPRYCLSIGESHMSSARYTPEFKDEAVRQIVGRGHSVAEVAERLGVSTHSLYACVSYPVKRTIQK